MFTKELHELLYAFVQDNIYGEADQKARLITNSSKLAFNFSRLFTASSRVLYSNVNDSLKTDQHWRILPADIIEAGLREKLF